MKVLSSVLPPGVKKKVNKTVHEVEKVEKKVTKVIPIQKIKKKIGGKKSFRKLKNIIYNNDNK